MDEQQFEIREQRHGDRDAVDLVTWIGNGNKMSLSVRKKNLRELRDKIDEYLGDTCDCDEEIR